MDSEKERVPADQMRVTTERRSLKVPLAPGRSQLDWLRKTAAMAATAPRNVTMDEVARHQSRDDAWMVLRGRVFRISDYIEYHPGGVEKLMLGAGKDGTKLFDKYHPYVNEDAILGKSMVGYLIPSRDDEAS